MTDCALPVTPWPESCLVCGGAEFSHRAVLWPELIAEWKISPEEAAYIDAQQGVHCVTCGSNLRSIALANALMYWRGFKGTLTHFVQDARQAALRTLEINEAGTLHSLLALLPGHQFGVYPAVDMMRLPFPDGSFDLVVHSDTLEHVEIPALGLSECRRVLASAGALVFTVPIVVGRMSKSRAGQLPSYHGAPGTVDAHMLVHTEFGSDVWATVLGAGFSSCELIPFCFPAGLAIIARR